MHVVYLYKSHVNQLLTYLPTYIIYVIDLFIDTIF